MPLRSRIVVAILMLLLGACASKPKDLIVLVPDPNGKVGTVLVTSASGVATLNEAYAAARVEEGGRTEVEMLAQSDVARTFARAIEARPALPVSFLVYFNEGTDEYTTESKTAVEGFFAEIARRKAAEVTVIGHTDRVGRMEDNDALSLKRAERVRADLVRLGIAPESINAAGRGEREPIVRSPDEVHEPRNRRVEISVR